MTTQSMEAPVGWNTGSPLDWLARLGGSMLSFFAQFGDSASGGTSGGYQAAPSEPEEKSYKKYDEEPVPQQKPPDPLPQCCHVFYPNGPYCNYVGKPQSYTCPPGYYRQWWFCCEGSRGREAACAECTQSQSTCWSGPFNCSTWWITDQPCR